MRPLHHPVTSRAGARRSTAVAIRIALACALGVAACARGPRPVPAGQTGVGRVVITGARAVDADDVAAGLGLVRARALGHPFARYLVALDRRRIEGYYLRHGFFSTTVASAVTRRDGLADVTFTVKEGPRARLAGVELVGLPADLAAAGVRAVIPIGDGRPFDYEAYDLAKPAIVAFLEERGYAHARIEATVIADRAAATATIRIVVDAGPKAVFGDVTIAGADGELLAAVKRRLQVAPGQPYALSRLADSRASLHELGRFSTVRIEPDLSDRAPVVPVAVQLALRPDNELRLGGGVGISPIKREVRGRSWYGRSAWPAPLWNAQLELRPALLKLEDEPDIEPSIEAVAALERLDLVRPRVRGVINAAFSYLAVEAYTSYGPRLHLAVLAPLYRRVVSAAVGWKIHELRFRNLDVALDQGTIDRLGLDARERVGAFDQSLIVDLRDDALTPTVGVYAELRAEQGTAAAGGAFDFVRLVPEVRGYYTVAATTLAVRLGLGVIHGDVPTTSRFFGGGASSQRGFGERRLSPAAVATIDGAVRRVPYGGAAMVLAGVEARRHLTRLGKQATLGAVAFLDGSDVAERVADLDVADLHWAAGGGIRIDFYVPIRVDVGYRLNRIGPTDPDPATSAWGRLAFHLSVGEAF